MRVKKLSFRSITPFVLIFFIILSTMLLITSIKKTTQTQPLQTLTIQTQTKTLLIDIEIANTPRKRAQGLMYRPSLEQNTGMLFVFPREQQQTFWMKNTLIPLDILFINTNLEIIEIITAQPCSHNPCFYYTSSLPARYVLELNAGFSQRNNLSQSDRIIVNTGL